MWWSQEKGLVMQGTFPDNSALFFVSGFLMTTLNILMAQVNTLVGDFTGNTTKIIETISGAQGREGTTVVVFPELTLCGYPPEDLLLRPSVERRVGQSLDRILCRG